MDYKFTNDFIKWVLSRFELGSLKEFAINSGWRGGQTTIYLWQKIGIPKQLTTILQERLMNLRSTGRVSLEVNVNLNDLFKEYQKENKKK